VNQREVHRIRTPSRIPCELRSAKTPTLFLIGEDADLETIESALRIAETGHLTLPRCKRTPPFPPSPHRGRLSLYQQPQIRAQLSLVLEESLSALLREWIAKDA